MRAGRTVPSKDSEGNPISTEFGFSQFKEHQKITLQELPEKTPAG